MGKRKNKGLINFLSHFQGYFPLVHLNESLEMVFACDDEDLSLMEMAGFTSLNMHKQSL